MEGWISLHRKIQYHWIWQNEKYLRAWIWFLIRANHDEAKVLIGADLVQLKRGEFITSIQNISKETKMSIQSTRTFLTLLEKDEMIVKKSTSKLTQITILKYDSYQGRQQTNNKPVTNQQQTSNKPTTTDNNVLIITNNENKVIPPKLDWIKSYCQERKNDVDYNKFFNFYESKNWMVGKNKMKDWQAAVRTWEDKKEQPRKQKINDVWANQPQTNIK